jgi:hypothetical protein
MQTPPLLGPSLGFADHRGRHHAGDDGGGRATTVTSGASIRPRYPDTRPGRYPPPQLEPVLARKRDDSFRRAAVDRTGTRLSARTAGC